MREIHPHFEEIGAVARHVPVVLRKEQEGSLTDLSFPVWVNFGSNEFSLGGVELIMRVVGDGGGEIADEDIPI